MVGTTSRRFTRHYAISTDVSRDGRCRNTNVCGDIEDGQSTVYGTLLAAPPLCWPIGRDRVPWRGVAYGLVAALSGKGREDQRATAGRLIKGSSDHRSSSRLFPASCILTAARPISFCSSRMAPTRRTMASSLGKMPTTSVLRLISPLMRSMEWIEWSWHDAPWGRSCRRARPVRPRP